MSDELNKLVNKVKTSTALKNPEPASQTETAELSKEEEWAFMQCEIRAAVERANAICSAGETALGDAYLKLQTYVTNKLPQLIKDGIETTARAHIKQTVDDMLLPLKEGTGGIARDVDDCRVKLRKMSWSWRLFVGQIGTGLVAAMIGGCIVYFGLLGDLRRYAEWGKKVEIKVNTYNPKTRDVLLQDFGKP